MKKLLLLIFLLGWFWGIRIPHPDTENVIFSLVVGPFANELECKKDLSYAISWFSHYIGEPSRVVGCVERKEA